MELREFDRSLPMALLRAREAVMLKFTPALKAHGLSPQQWRVIRALHETKELDISELAERCYLLPPSLSRILQNLEKRGLVSRQTSHADSRRSMISLTAKGKGLFRKIAPKSVERYDYITQKFGYGKLELLYELLDELVAKVEETEERAD